MPGRLERETLSSFRRMTGTYIPSQSYDSDRYRLGLAYFSAGPLNFGLNSEGVRHNIQNRFHDHIGSPWLGVCQVIRNYISVFQAEGEANGNL
mgnify:CR=1 FL=1